VLDQLQAREDSCQGWVDGSGEVFLGKREQVIGAVIDYCRFYICLNSLLWRKGSPTQETHG
jgi:hypothetical protein